MAFSHYAVCHLNSTQTKRFTVTDWTSSCHVEEDGMKTHDQILKKTFDSSVHQSEQSSADNL